MPPKSSQPLRNMFLTAEDLEAEDAALTPVAAATPLPFVKTMNNMESLLSEMKQRHELKTQREQVMTQLERCSDSRAANILKEQLAAVERDLESKVKLQFLGYVNFRTFAGILPSAVEYCLVER